jgi:hypothetical protein
VVKSNNPALISLSSLTPADAKADEIVLDGGAHTVAPQRIDEHFYIQVPFGRFINPVSKTDWEGSGVEPDIKVPAADALEEALKRARGGP